MARKLTFRHVEAIRSVMLTGTVTGAAARLHVTQPAVSHLIREIDEILGFPLFERRLGRLVPTPKAQLLHNEIERAYSGLHAINEFGRRLRHQEGRAIHISSIPVLSIAMVPQVINDYHHFIRYDFFEIHTRSTEQVIGAVCAKRADIGFALRMEAVPGVKSEVISRLDALCLLPPGHRLQDADVVTPADLQLEPMISLSHHEGLAEIVQNAFDPLEVPLPIVECPMATAACSMVEAGIGVSLLDPVAAYPFRDSKIVFKRFLPSAPFIFCAYWIEASETKLPFSQIVTYARNHLMQIAVSFESKLKPRSRHAETGSASS